jgi:hypothetical protein
MLEVLRVELTPLILLFVETPMFLILTKLHALGQLFDTEKFSTVGYMYTYTEGYKNILIIDNMYLILSKSIFKVDFR